MNIDRIKNFLNKKIKAETDGGLFSNKDKAEAYREVLEYIQGTPKGQSEEVELIKQIFNKHYSLYIQKKTNTEKAVKYVFKREDDRMIKDTFIPQLKAEMEEYEIHFGEISIEDFFEHFMKNMDPWWKSHMFTIYGITKHFKQIYTKIITVNSTSQTKKATVNDVLSDLQVEHGQ